MRRISLTFFLFACFALPANAALFGPGSAPQCTLAAGSDQLSIAGSVLRTCGAMDQGSTASVIDSVSGADCSDVPAAVGSGSTILFLQWDDSVGAAGEWVCVADQGVAVVNTNAETICSLAETLRGDGTCVVPPGDTTTSDAGVTYVTAVTDDFAVGSTALFGSNLFVDVDTGDTTIGTGNLTLAGAGKAVVTVPSETAGSSLVLPEASDNGTSAFTLSVPADLTASKNCQVTATGLLPTNCLQHALQECFVVYRPVDEIQNTDDIDSFWRASAALTLTEVWCETDTGTVNMDLAIDDGSREDVMGTDLVCASTAVSDSTGLAGNMAAGDRLDLLIASVATNPTRLSVCVGYDYD